MKIAENVRYIGVNDRLTDLFEGQYRVPNGIAYNSYLILDEKNAALDTVDARFAGAWFERLDAALEGKTPDYLVVHHMEPDHSASIKAFADRFPNAKIVASAQAFKMMEQFFGTDFAERREIVKEGSTLDLGAHKLNFIGAPMVHWPEVLMSYEEKEKILFSADGFGKFGALDSKEPWLNEARRYYIGIVGKFGPQVQAVLKKAAGLDIQTICPLHGPTLTENLGYYLGLYNTWSNYDVETPGVVIAYASIYGHTADAALLLADKLCANGSNVAVYDLARCDIYRAVADAFRFGKLVLATPTYNAGVFPFMADYIKRLTDRNFQKRTVAFIENGSWAPNAAKVMTKLFETSKEINILDTVTLRGSMTEENKAQIASLAEKLA